MFKRQVLWFLLLLTPALLAQDAILDRYIRDALENNLALKQHTFSYRESMAALTEARGMFMPSLSIDARYSRAGGGRMIDIPVGTLVNPVYQTLNQLLGQNRFPTNIPDQTVPFLRKEEQETKIRVIQPIFQPQVYYNYKIKSNLKEVEEAGKNAYARELVAEVKTAYFNYLKTVQVLKIYDQTESLLKENLRVSESLFKNQKVTKEAVYRARAELSQLEQEKSGAINDQTLAASYFNFLLNRPLDADISLSEVQAGETAGLNLGDAQKLALQNRDELKQLRSAEKAADNHISLSKSAFLPGLTAVLDYGIQGEKYRFTSKDDYWMASAVLQWNLFNGFQDKARVQQAMLQKRKQNSRLQEVEKQVQLQVRQAYYNMEVSKQSITTAADRLVSARQAFQIVDKKYGEGMTPQIDYLDARNAFTRAEINQILTTYDYRIRMAELERATATYPLK